MNIIGQTNIIENIDKITSIDKLPKSIIISGNFGSGRHTVYNYICDKFKLEKTIIDYELNSDILNEMYNLSLPKMYLIDLDALSENKRLERFQNTLLKFIEEPPEYAWITIIIYNFNILLETIANRCRIFSMQPYSIEELCDISNAYNKSWSKEELTLLNTPYNIINVEQDTLIKIRTLAKNIVDNMHKANISNALSIRNKLSTDTDIQLFINIFIELLYEYYINSYDSKYYKAMILTKNLCNNLYVLNVNKTYLIDNYLLELKQILDDRISNI